MFHNSRKRILILIILNLWLFSFATSEGFSAPLQEDSIEIHIFYSCELCTNPAQSDVMNETVYPFAEAYQANTTIIFYELDEEGFDTLISLVGDDQLVGKDQPYVVFINGEIAQVLGYKDITEKSLTNTYNNFQSGIVVPTSPSFAFTGYVILIGLVTGINPCLFILVLFLISRSLMVGDDEEQTQGRSRVMLRIGIVYLGVVAFYLLLGIFFFQIPASLFSILRPILLLILLVFGAYYIIFYKKVQQGLFRTPDRLKNIIQQVVERNNLGYDFSMGFIFASIKIPCIGGLYLVLLNRIRTNPAQGLFYLGLFNVSLILPLFIIMGAVAMGIIGLSRTKNFTETHRGTIRLLTGILLIIAAIIELFVPTSVYELG